MEMLLNNGFALVSTWTETFVWYAGIQLIFIHENAG